MCARSLSSWVVFKVSSLILDFILTIIDVFTLIALLVLVESLLSQPKKPLAFPSLTGRNWVGCISKK